MNIQAVDIRDHWTGVKPAIQKIMADLPWQDFHIEDLYAQCLKGDAVLFIDGDVSPRESFFIAKIKKNEVGENILFLWIAHSTSPETAAQSHEGIEEIARSAGCVAVEFMLGSPDLAEYAASFGFTKQMILVRKDI